MRCERAAYLRINKLTPMIIRPYTKEDQDALLQLWRECRLLLPQNDPRRDIERKLKVNPEWFVVGTKNTETIASCMIGYDGHRGWINYLAVSPDHQRQGYARQLMGFAEKRLLAAGCPKINLQIRSSNQSAREFYEKLGYSTDPVISMGKRLIPDS